MLQSGHQLLPKDLACTRIQQVRELLGGAAEVSSLQVSTVAALVAAVEQRISRQHQYTATNLEAAADVAEMYVEFDDYQCFVNEKLLVNDMDSGAASGSTNSVVPGAMSPSCCRSACIASTGHAS